MVTGTGWKVAPALVLSLVCLWIGGCQSTTDDASKARSGGQGVAGGDLQGRGLRALTKAPLRNSRTVLVPAADCRSILSLIALRPEVWMNVAFVRWENRQLTQSDGTPRLLPNPAALRTFYYQDVSIAERVHGARSGKWFAYSYVSARHSDAWPFQDHLGVLSTRQGTNGCTVTWKNYYNLSWSWSSGRAEERLLEELVPRALEKLARDGAKLSAVERSPSPSVPPSSRESKGRP